MILIQMNTAILSMTKKRPLVVSFSRYKKKKKILNDIYIELVSARDSGDYKRSGDLAKRYLRLK
jgi:hypothetical protein